MDELDSSDAPCFNGLSLAFRRLHHARLCDLRTASDKLLRSFENALLSDLDRPCMLPSYFSSPLSLHRNGHALALDLGGSTLRVAAVELVQEVAAEHLQNKAKHRLLMHHQASWTVTDAIKSLPATALFDWMAKQLEEVMHGVHLPSNQIVPMGVTWSFPIRQTSMASGIVQQMGKGYAQWEELVDTDLRSHIMAACKRQGLPVRMTALLNDTEAALLAHGCEHSSTRLSLVWGTGVNAAVLLTASALKHKLDRRFDTSAENENSFLVNTEISMFGGSLWHQSEADLAAEAHCSQPGFQPLEQLISGRFLGEIFRCSLLRCIEAQELFNGAVPDSIREPFSVETALLSQMEVMDTHELGSLLEEKWHLSQTPNRHDLLRIQSLCILVAERAATLMAICIFTLWRLQCQKTQGQDLEVDCLESDDQTIDVACVGAVIERHPSIRGTCQAVLDQLCEAEQGLGRRTRLRLVIAEHTSLLGAAVSALHADGSLDGDV